MNLATSPVVQTTAVQELRTFKALTAGSNVIMPTGKKLVFGGPVGGHGAYVTNKAIEIAFLQEMVQNANGQIWEEASPEKEAVIIATSPVVTDTETAASDVKDLAVKAVNPRLEAMAAALGSIDANKNVPLQSAG